MKKTLGKIVKDGKILVEKEKKMLENKYYAAFKKIEGKIEHEIEDKIVKLSNKLSNYKSKLNNKSKPSKN